MAWLRMRPNEDTIRAATRKKLLFWHVLPRTCAAARCRACTMMWWSPMKGKWQWLIDNNNNSSSKQPLGYSRRAKCVIRFLQHLCRVATSIDHNANWFEIFFFSRFHLLSIQYVPLQTTENLMRAKWTMDFPLHICAVADCVASWLTGPCLCHEWCTLKWNE